MVVRPRVEPLRTPLERTHHGEHGEGQAGRKKAVSEEFTTENTENTETTERAENGNSIQSFLRVLRVLRGESSDERCRHDQRAQEWSGFSDADVYFEIFSFFLPGRAGAGRGGSSHAVRPIRRAPVKPPLPNGARRNGPLHARHQHL